MNRIGTGERRQLEHLEAAEVKAIQKLGKLHVLAHLPLHRYVQRWIGNFELLRSANPLVPSPGVPNRPLQGCRED